MTPFRVNWDSGADASVDPSAGDRIRLLEPIIGRTRWVMRVFHDVGTALSRRTSRREMVATTTLRPHAVEPAAVGRLRDQLAERDEIIVALQHVIRDLRHELENLRVEDAYATFAHARASAVGTVRRNASL